MGELICELAGSKGSVTLRFDDVCVGDPRWLVSWTVRLVFSREDGPTVTTAFQTLPVHGYAIREFREGCQRSPGSNYPTRIELRDRDAQAFLVAEFPRRD